MALRTLGVVVPWLLCTASCPPRPARTGSKCGPTRRTSSPTLVGTWKFDAALGKRLAHNGIGEQFEFRDDAKVVGKVPEAIAAKLRDRRIYLAGVMVLRGKEQPFLLTEASGNPTVVWFRDRDGDPMGDAESLSVMLVRGEVKQADLLFVGGDSNNQSFAAYGRETKVTGKLEPAAAITEMIRLLEAGRAREFVETYVSPEDLGAMAKDGKTIDKLATRFEGERGKELIAILQTISKQAPTMSDDGALATWQVGQKPGALRLQRIDGR